MNLQILRTKKGFDVYYVNPEDLARIQDRQIFRSGLNATLVDFDFDKYDQGISRRGYPPPADMIGIVHPNVDSIKPGIEIMPARSLFRNNGVNFYTLIDCMDMDNVNPELKVKLERHKKKRLSEIQDFLENQIYSFANQGRETYERNIVAKIEKTLQRPERVFDLHVLGEKGAEWIQYNAIDLNKALDAGIHLNIDWLLANKILGLYATMK